MHGPLLLLAQDQTTGTTATGSGRNVIDYLNILFRPGELLDALAQMPLILAGVVVVVGLLCIVNGYRWHKWLVAILAFGCGIGIGWKLSQQMGKSVVVAVAFGGLCAIVATPLLRITVAIFGGLTGAFIGANTWTAIDSVPVDQHWAGAAIGFVILAMTSIVLFKLVIVVFTSVGGAIMVVCGAITLLMYVPDWEPAIRQSLTDNPLLVPLLLALAAVSGFVVQESRLRANGVKVLARESAE